jgi:pimeloyl-ACP methyl ester carboxylesterase
MRVLSKGLVAAAALVLQQPATAQQPSPGAPAVDLTLQPYASTKDSVRLPDGRTMHMVCTGQGSPTVILLAGMFDWSIAWNQVQPSVGARTRVCAWDRAGLGLSDPPAEPQLIDATTADLGAGLAAGHVEPPYVLVGHSVGGYESLLFADRRPSQVAGMVLVDPQYPDEVRILSRVTPATTEFTDRMSREYPNPLIDLLRRCSAGLRAGTIRKGGPDPERCLQPDLPASYPPELTAALRERLANAAPDTIASNFDALVSIYSLELLDANARMAVNPDRNYGSMPLVVLTAGKPNVPPGLPEAVKAELPIGAAEWRRAHRELAALSTRGTHRIIEDSLHDIPHQNPQAVIGAILEVVEEVRSLSR